MDPVPKIETLFQHSGVVKMYLNQGSNEHELKCHHHHHEQQCNINATSMQHHYDRHQRYHHHHLPPGVFDGCDCRAQNGEEGDA